MWIENRDFDSMNWTCAQIGAREHCVGEKAKSEKLNQAKSSVEGREYVGVGTPRIDYRR
jgi:hypothetical protein